MVLMYADETILLAPTKEGLQKATDQIIVGTRA